MSALLSGSASGHDDSNIGHEDGKYTGSDMDYTYGDTTQKMQTMNDDIRILLRKFPSHAVSLLSDLVKNGRLPGKTVCIHCRCILRGASLMQGKYSKS